MFRLTFLIFPDRLSDDGWTYILRRQAIAGSLWRGIGARLDAHFGGCGGGLGGGGGGGHCLGGGVCLAGARGCAVMRAGDLRVLGNSAGVLPEC